MKINHEEKISKAIVNMADFVFYIQFFLHAIQDLAVQQSQVRLTGRQDQ